MNKIISAGLFSLGLMNTAPVSSSEFGAVILSPDIVEIILQYSHQIKSKIQTDTHKNIASGHENLSGTKEKYTKQVFQIVGHTAIPTTLGAVEMVRTFDCRENTTSQYYFSKKDAIIGTDNFVSLTSNQIKNILQLPQCKR